MSPPQTPSKMSPPTPPPPSIWVISYIKLQFFARIRRFLQSKTGRKRHRAASDQFDESRTRNATADDRKGEVHVMVRDYCEGDGDDDESVVLQRTVKRLHFGSWEEKEMAAKEIERLAREDVKIRKLMAELGVVPALVAMVGSELAGRRRAAVKALIELADGTYTNKALMVEAGILSKLPNNINNVDESTRHEIAELLLSLSSLAITQFPIASSEVVPYIVSILECCSTSLLTKESCLGVLNNLAAVLDNAGSLVSNGAVHTLLKLCSSKELSEKALAALGLLVVTLMGKRAIENSSAVPGSLIEILTWEDKPKCQELSAYILMILAHQSSAQRDKMAKSGIVPMLLEVALLGSPLAQKRALKLLQWLRDERQTKMGPHSGPQARRDNFPILSMGSPENQREAQAAGRKMMNSLVKQSLHNNMEMITRRANIAAAGNEDDPSKLKSLVVSTSSKSLPY